MRFVSPSLRWRTFLAATAVASTIFTGVSASAQYSYSYPACNGPCPMLPYQPNQPAARVMTGAVPIYVLWYGPFSTDGDAYLQSILPYFIASLSDSSYQAISTTYSGWNTQLLDNISGVVSGKMYLAGQQYDTAMSRGPNLNDDHNHGDVANELESYIANGAFPYSQNAVYLLLAGRGIAITDNAGTPLTGPNCGYNNVATPPGAGDFTYATAIDAFDWGRCNWGFQTPNNAGGDDTEGFIDGELTVIAHEVNESITNPSGPGGGWDVVSPGGGTGTQMADFCEGFDQTGQGTAYAVPLSNGATAIANVHGIFGSDFMLDTLRANADYGTIGYCVNEYGGVFWKQDFGFSFTPYTQNNGDWAQNSYKGECKSGQPLTGLSTFAGVAPAPSPVPPTGTAHAVMCKSVSDSQDFVQNSSCTPVYFDHGYGSAGTVQLYQDPPPVGDWANLYYKGECQSNQFVAGVSQSQSGIVNGILCCTPPSPGAVTHQSCQAQLVNSSPTLPPDPGYDWDWGYYKATCPSDVSTPAYVAGVSVDTSTGQVHSVLCCYP